MQTDNSIEAGILYSVGFLFLIDGLIYLIRFRVQKAFNFGALLLFYGSACINSAVLVSNLNRSVPFVLVVDHLCVTLAVVSSIFMMKSFWESDFKWKSRYLLFFIFPLIQIIFLIPFFMESPKYRTAILNDYRMNKKPMISILPVVAFASFISILFASIYIIYGFFSKFRWKSSSQKIQKKVFFSGLVIVIYNIYLPVQVFEHIFLPVNSWKEKSLEYVFYFFFGYLFFRYLQIWPYYFKYDMTFFDIKTFKIEKYFNNYISAEDIPKFTERLNHLVRREKVYLEENISLKTLAKKMDVSSHQLSAYLNQHVGQNFAEFINSKRIEDAKSILEKEDIKVIDICFDLGYNSPSVFYKEFKKVTGVSPVQWRGEQKSKPQPA